MNEAHFVNILNGENTFSNIEASDVLRESVVLDQHGHQVASWQELHNEIQELWILKRVVELNNPGRFRLGQHISLGFDVCQLFRLDNKRPK